MVIGIVVGSQSGNAEIVAELAAEKLAANGFGVATADLASTPDGLLTFDALLGVCSTYGTGEIPGPLAKFAAALPSVDLGQRPVGVIALGDRLYTDTFCGGGRRLAELLVAAGGRLLLPMLTIDAGEHPDPEVPALQWLDNWSDELRRSEAAA